VNSTIELVLGIVALVFGIVSEVESNAKNWAGWGVVALSIIVVLTNLK
jgi:hypothetical protein